MPDPNDELKAAEKRLAGLRRELAENIYGRLADEQSPEFRGFHARLLAAEAEVKRLGGRP